MSTALFAFDDPAMARRARELLIARGVPSRAVRLHAAEREAQPSPAEQVDEQVTGGIVTNFLGLLQGLFDWDRSSHGAASFEETYRRGGAVIDIEADTDADRETVDAVMAELTSGSATAVRRTHWSGLPSR